MTFHSQAPLPAARTTDLVTTTTADATLVYDVMRHELHQLNPVAATIWQLLDSARSASEVLATAQVDLGDELSLETVQVALSTLAGANLLA